MKNLKLTIITVCLNNLEGLKKTVESVVNQSFEGYEYILIDGGSTDGSLDFIIKNKGIFQSWVSERDLGIYDAMNKGILRATGEYVHFLNAGDTFFNESSLEQLMNVNLCNDIVYTDYAGAGNLKKYIMPEKLSFKFFYSQSLNHQACLIRKRLFEEFEMYNINSPIIADWEFFIKSIILFGASTQYVPQTFILFDFVDSMSNKIENKEFIRDRRLEVLNSYFPLLMEDIKYIEAIESSNTYKILKCITKYRNFFR
jgi:glycosyltransferase involved in cell wall biosynthesis